MAPLVIVGGGAAAATLVLFIKLAFGRSLWSQLNVWPMMFLVVACPIALALILRRRWTESVIVTLFIALLAFAAWRWMVPIYAALSGTDGVMIIPVNP